MKTRKVRRVLSIILSALMTCALVLPASASTVPANFAESGITEPATIPNQEGPVNTWKNPMIGGTTNCPPAHAEPEQKLPDIDPPMPITTTPPITGEPPLYNEATSITADELLTLVNYLRDIYYLEARVNTLYDYNQFDPERSYFVFKNDSNIPQSIWEQLSPIDQFSIAHQSTYQSFVKILASSKYASDEEFRTLVDYFYDGYMNNMPEYVRTSLVGFVPRTTTALLNPDQLCTLGTLIVNTEGYKDLQRALKPLVDFYSAERITEAFPPAEITLMYAEISHAALNIWSDGNSDLNLAVGTAANGEAVLVPIPTTSTGA